MGALENRVMSPFAQGLLDRDSGIFAPGVPLKTALEEACRRLGSIAGRSGQTPLTVRLEAIDSALCMASALDRESSVQELLNTRTQAQRDDHDYEHRDAGTRHGAGGGASSSNVKSKRPLEGDGSQGAASKMPKPENHEGARSKAQGKRDARTDRDIGAAGSSPDAKRPKLDLPWPKLSRVARL